MLLLWSLSTCLVFVLLTEALDESHNGVLKDLKSLPSWKDSVCALRRRARSVQHYMFPQPRFPAPVDVPQCAQEAMECGHHVTRQCRGGLSLVYSLG